MTSTFWMLFVVLLSQPAPEARGSGEPPATTRAVAEEDPAVQRVLIPLHRRGLDLQGFEAKLSLAEEGLNDGSELVQVGWVRYDAAGSRIRVMFETKSVEKKPARAEPMEFVLDKGVLIERRHLDKRDIVRQVSDPAAKADPLKLESGSFPLPIGQDPAEVRRQFEVTSLPAELGRAGVRLVPNEGTRMGAKFRHIDVWVDPVTGFPTRIKTLDRNRSKIRQVDLGELRVNPQPALSDADFALPDLPGWQPQQ